jgi:hypothetical protein
MRSPARPTAIYYCLIALAASATATCAQDQQNYLLTPRFARGDRWVEVSQLKTEYHSLLAKSQVIPIHSSLEERTKSVSQVIEADPVSGDLKKLDCRYEYAYQEAVSLDHSRKQITNLPFHTRQVHVERRVDDLGTIRVDVRIDGAALTPEVEAALRGRFGTRESFAPAAPVKPGDSWNVSSEGAIQSLFGERVSGSLEFHFDAVGAEELSSRRCAILKYSGDLVIAVPAVPGKDPRDDWEKRADKWRDHDFKPIGGHTAATDTLHISGGLWVDLETRRPVRHHYEGTIQDEPEPGAGNDPSVTPQRGDIKYEWRAKPLAAGAAAPAGDANDGPPRLTVYRQPQGLFDVSFQPTWGATREGEGVRLTPAEDTKTSAVIRVETVAAGTTAQAAWEKLATPRIARLPYVDAAPPDPMELAGRPGLCAFYRFRASNDPGQPGQMFSGSTCLVVVEDKAFILDFVAIAEHFPDEAQQFAIIEKSFRAPAPPANAANDHAAMPGPLAGAAAAAAANARPNEPEPAFRDRQDRFRLLDLAGMKPAQADGGAADVLILKPADATPGVEIHFTLETQPDPKTAVQRYLRRAAELGEPFDIVHEGPEGNRYITVVSRNGTRQRIEAMPGHADGSVLIARAMAPNLESYRRYADTFDKVLAGLR